jgi:acyl-coenzyme A synthetase/AMP-(fatty) acid ligase
VVTERYYNRPASTKLAKIPDNGAVRHRMGDVGYLDGQGRLWMCGRKAHRVETAKGRLFTVPCEAIFNAHPAVFRSALVGVGEPGHEQPVVCVELEKGQSADEAKLSAALRELAVANPLTADIETFLFRPSLPVDVRHNAKIFREQLKIWATKALA